MAKTKITRRVFAGRLGVAGVAGLALGSGLVRAQASQSAQAPVVRGIWKTVRRPKQLESPVDAPADQVWRYLLSYPLQITPSVAALYCNMKRCDIRSQDFGSGNDLLLFDRLDGIDPAKAVKISRLTVEPNPNNGGRPAYMNRFPGSLGFVPVGAKGADGRPHPHAGTGFVLVSLAARPMDTREGVASFPDNTGTAMYKGAKRYAALELYQLRYESGTVVVSGGERIVGGDLLPDSAYTFYNGGMGCAIADGDDLVIGAEGFRRGETTGGSGLMRWRRRDGKWVPEAYEPVTPQDGSLEASLMRDVDGAILMHVRARRWTGPPIRVWRQATRGGPWELKINLNGMIPSTPITLNRAVDGTPFLAGNLWQPEYRLPAGLHSDGGISRLEPVGWRGERSTLCVWPLNEARDGLDAQLIVRDPRVEFGLPPHGTIWAADHPMASPVRLADGQWRCLMGFRMLEWKENTHFIPPSPQTGSYLDEVVSFGPPRPLWEFVT